MNLTLKSSGCGQIFPLASLVQVLINTDAHTNVTLAPTTTVAQKAHVDVVCCRQHWLKPKFPTSSTHSN